MQRRRPLSCRPATPQTLVVLLTVVAGAAGAAAGEGWRSHDPARPRPEIVTPAPPMHPGAPPSDAVVLFDGTSVAAWRSRGGPASWTIEDGALVGGGGKGNLATADGFGDVQLHVEWAAPLQVTGSGQGRGNSGVYLMGLYEVQVLDSYGNDTYPDGQAAALYGVAPPLVNASRPPGEWQTYDIVFRRPRFAVDGTLLAPARITLFHNGVLAQDAQELPGPTSWLTPDPYQPHPDRLPLVLQDHGNPVRYRNIWLRPLAEEAPAGPPPRRASAPALGESALDRYLGLYRLENGAEVFAVTRDDWQLRLEMEWKPLPLDLVPLSATEFELRRTAATVEFEFAAEEGPPAALTLVVGTDRLRATRVADGEIEPQQAVDTADEDEP